MTEGEKHNLNAIFVKIPPFFKLTFYFDLAKLKINFLAEITSDEITVNYNMATDAMYATVVRYILTKPSTTEQYLKLKTELIFRLSRASQDHRTRQLVEHVEMGDGKSAHYLRHLRTLAGTVVPDTVLKALSSSLHFLVQHKLSSAHNRALRPRRSRCS